LRVYLINLDRCPEREARIRRLLAPSGLPLERVRAVDGLRLRDRDRPAPARPGALPADRTVLSRFEIALILSHRRAWRRFLRTGEPRCVILEDDVYIGEGFADFVRNPALGDCDFDIIKLETIGAPVAVSRRRSRTINGRFVARLRSTHMGAAGYMVTREAAKRLLALSAGAPCGMDSILFDFDRMRTSGLEPLGIGQVIPAPIIQHDARAQHGAQGEVLPEAAMLTSVIGARRGRKLGRPPLTPERLRREALRPFHQLWLYLRRRTVEFR
jgi:glycosyl transferase family 25